MIYAHIIEKIVSLISDFEQMIFDDNARVISNLIP